MECNFLVKTAVAAIVAMSFLSGAGLPCLSATTEQALADHIKVFEHRFFFRLYANDPIEKRLERIELLVFGATQAGSNEERVARLKKTVNDRDAKSGVEVREKEASAAPQAGPSETAGKSARVPNSSSQYPILNTLEWRSLKKTFPAETLDQRLERMESKLFGQPSPAMAYADRVERLKRTLGVGMAQEDIPKFSGPLGPMPKARPRSSPDVFGGVPNASPRSLPEIFGNSPGGTVDPFGMGGFPFGGFGATPFGTTPGMSDIFKQLEQQMEQMRQMPGGFGIWQWDQESGSWVDPRTGQKLKPGEGGKSGPPAPSLPFSKPKPAPEIPPYDDPNSI